MGTWRQYYSTRIAEIIKKHEGKSIPELKKILQGANPGQYRHMQRAWANEYMIQLGLSRKKGGGYHKPDSNQQKMF